MIDPAKLTGFSPPLSGNNPLATELFSKKSLENQMKMKELFHELDLSLNFDPASGNKIQIFQAENIVSLLNNSIKYMETSKVNSEINSDMINKINAIEALFQQSFPGSNPDEIALLKEISHIKTHVNELNTSSNFSFEKLKNLPGTEEITPELCQIQVLNQMADGTTSGFENCGFHALKNSLLMLSDYNSEELNTLLNDKEIFSDFYNDYCLPHVISKPIGKRDASLPVLRQILENIETRSKSPEPNLLAKILKNANNKEKLAILNMSTTTGTDEGAPILCFADIFQSIDGFKLYQFAKNPGPDTLTLVFGSDTFNHWFSLQIHKDAQNNLSFAGCDSTDNHQKILGEFSPLGKLAALIKEMLKDPDSLLQKVYAPLDENLSYRAGWIGPDGSIDNKDALKLLDDQPNPLLASSLAPKGSQKEIILANCVAAFRIIQEGGWLSSSDLQNYLKTKDLEILIHFYLLRLQTDDPWHPILSGIYQEFQNNKNENPVVKIFEEAIQNVDSQSKALTPTQLDQVRSLFTMFQRFYLERKSLSQIEDVNKRMYAMNTMSGSAGIEPGFTAGTKPQEAEKFLLHKIHLLLLIYQEAKKLERLNDLMRAIYSGGDGCLTARYGRVEEFHAALHNLELQEASTTDQAISLAPMIALSEFLTDFFDNDENPVKSMSEAVADKNFFLENQVNLAGKFATYGSVEKGLPFRLHLKKLGIISDENHIDWKETMPKILNTDEFNHWLALAKGQAILELNI